MTIDDVIALANGSARARLDDGETFRSRLEASARGFASLVSTGQTVYGVTTGFGESCLNSVDQDHFSDLSYNLIQFHGCGVGPVLSDEESAAVVAASLASLTSGWSAVRPIVLERLCTLLNHRILPQIPCQGSVGASGDLTPLSYVAAALIGDREVSFDGRVMGADEALRSVGLDPLSLAPKESLAVMNGTSVMTALVCIAHHRARRLARLAAALTAMASDVMRGNRSHFDDRIFAAKPHAGQRAFARWVREDIELERPEQHDGRIQDRYSVRCAPHVVGVLLDALAWTRGWIEIELNGANYNPLVDPDTGDVLHGGNFYGGHACFAADALKNAIANVADLLDRQLALLCSASTSNGLPENLVARTGGERTSHHGFKAMQIGASALTAEALKLTMPASVFIRSTECHNQDKVSMGTIAARDCIRVLEMTESVAAICTLAMCQAVDLRGGENCHARAISMRDAIRTVVPFNDGDRRQDADIRRVVELLRTEALPIGEVDFA